MANTKKAKKDPERDRLTVELIGLVPRIDEEGLSFLIEQAKILLHNQEVDKLNAAQEASQGMGREKTAGKTPKKQNDFKIEASESGSSYYIVYRGDWIMFSKDEMIQLAGIVSLKESELEIREKLFSWFERERMDVLGSIPMADKFDERLKKLVALIKKTFKVRYS